MVCSAGGLDALSQVLAPLPASFPAALLILQHTTPDMPSHLAAILDQRTALSVAAASDRSVLASGVALVAPSGSHVLVTVEGAVEIIRSGGTPPYRPSADLLLTTLALAAGSQAIAVVLSGRGNDAATGATAVLHFGGTVIASDEASSSEYAMPLASIDREDAVHIVALADIPGLLQRLVTG
jgi:two-component system chemotaxis response regulator CheB